MAHQLLTCIDDVNLQGNNINTIKKTETLIDASKEVDLEVNVRKNNYVGLSPECRAKS
jgi:hypothetical protein